MKDSSSRDGLVVWVDSLPTKELDGGQSQVLVRSSNCFKYYHYKINGRRRKFCS